MKKLILLFFAIIIITGCGKRMATDIIEDITFLEYHDMKINEDSIYRSSDAIMYEDKVILVDDIGGNLLKVIDLSQGDIISQSFVKGRGPEEVGYITSVSKVFEKKDEFYIVDPNNRRLTFFNIDSLIANRNHFFKKQVINSIELRPFHLLQYSDSSYIAIGINTLNDKRLTIFNEYLEPIAYYLDYPISKKEDPSLNNFLLGAIFQSGIAIRPDGKRMVSVIYMSDYFDIIDLTKDEPETIFSKYSYLPEYKITGRNTHAVPSGAKQGYRGVQATDKYILLFYSEDPTDRFTDRVLVTDWDGKPVMKFGLELPVRQIVTDSDHRYLYGFSAAEMDGGHNRLLRYELTGLQ
ncbi:MAG: BF3164 family lipoprotein [Bacteroidales bacterium]|nr:BF3164 family lipoprotein [Bacteroidales bacterium]